MRRRFPYRVPRLAPVVAVAVLAFVNCAVWALIVPYLQGPDESAHVGYAVHLAETGHPPHPGGGGPFSDEVAALASGLSTFDMLQNAGVTRPPWSAARERAYKQAVARGLGRKNGGGETTASVDGPVYFAFPAAAYRIFYSASFTDRMLAMRLASALLASLTVAFVYLTVRELVPSRPWAPIAAALLAAFQPMVGFMGGVVNADNGVNLAGALLVYLIIRAFRRGLTVKLVLAIPLTLVLGILAKATMFAYVPVVALAFLLLLVQRRGTIREWGALAVTFAVLLGAWAVIAPRIHHSFIPVPGGGGAVGLALGLGGTLSYIWQIFLPPLPFMHHDFAPGIHPVWDIYVVRAWGGFGGLDVNMPHPVFVGLAIAMPLLVVLALRGLWLERRFVRAHASEIAILVLSFICVAGFSHAAFARANPALPIQEQGRYLFLAITPAAATAVAACFGIGRRLAPVAAITLTTSMVALSAFAQLYVFTAYFT